MSVVHSNIRTLQKSQYGITCKAFTESHNNTKRSYKLGSLCLYKQVAKSRARRHRDVVLRCSLSIRIGYYIIAVLKWYRSVEIEINQKVYIL